MKRKVKTKTNDGLNSEIITSSIYLRNFQEKIYFYSYFLFKIISNYIYNHYLI